MNTFDSLPGVVPVIAEHELPYSLTTAYQLQVAKLTPSDPSRGEKKTTGIWCKYERND